MRTTGLLFFTAALLTLGSCEKECEHPPAQVQDTTTVGDPTDYRDAIAGEYLGIDTCSSGTWGGPGGDPTYTTRTFTVVKDTMSSVQVFIDGWAYVLQEDLTFSYVSGSVVDRHGSFTASGGGPMRLHYARAYYETGSSSSCHFTGTKL